MTEKQENILNAALELFAEEGFKSTSTSKVAKRAGVSEGLIFRHFENKEGLLNAIVKMGEERAQSTFAGILLEKDAKTRLRNYIELALKISQDQEAVDFWKLQFKIKWELEIYGEHKIKAIRDLLVETFRELKYNDPEAETDLLMTFMDGLATRLMLQKGYNLGRIVNFLKQKYKV